ncbi:MAG TPA: DUF418 domain-containing protein [Bacillaceae bacterium]
MSQNTGPASDGRIQSLDVLRGISLLGILLVNMISFHSPFGYYNPYEWWKYGDATVYTWLDIFVQGSFYPIFAMMFGYGMVIMRQRAHKNGTPFYSVSIRRLLVLLFIGILHVFLVWHGDILITYALMGMVLLLFIRLPGPILMGVAAVMYLLPQLIISALLILMASFDSVSLADFTDIVGMQQSAAAYSTGSFAEITGQRITDWAVQNGIREGGLFLYLFMILPLMMLGAGAAKLHWLQKAAAQKKKWTIILLVGLILGLAIKTIPINFSTSISYQYVQDAIGGPILGIAYAAAIILLMTSQKAGRLLKPFASAGKMSITLYLMQSIIGTLIFYHYGLGLYGQVSMATGTWLAVALFALQVVFAELWLSKFRQGPVERLWRLGTYGKRKMKMEESK